MKFIFVAKGGVNMLCPIMSSALEKDYCIRDTCAFYNIKDKECAILSIAKRIGGEGENVKHINNIRSSSQSQ